jgi:hypothetical protein
MMCVMRQMSPGGNQIVTPAALKQHITELWHESYLDTVSTKRNSSSRVWWPGIDVAVEKLVKHSKGLPAITAQLKHRITCFHWCCLQMLWAYRLAYSKVMQLNIVKTKAYNSSWFSDRMQTNEPTCGYNKKQHWFLASSYAIINQSVHESFWDQYAKYKYLLAFCKLYNYLTKVTYVQTKAVLFFVTICESTNNLHILHYTWPSPRQKCNQNTTIPIMYVDAHTDPQINQSFSHV